RRPRDARPAERCRPPALADAPAAAALAVPASVIDSWASARRCAQAPPWRLRAWACHGPRSVTARLPEAYQWLLVPLQQPTGASVEWQVFRLSEEALLHLLYRHVHHVWLHEFDVLGVDLVQLHRAVKHLQRHHLDLVHVDALDFVDDGDHSDVDV